MQIYRGTDKRIIYAIQHFCCGLITDVTSDSYFTLEYGYPPKVQEHDSELLTFDAYSFQSKLLDWVNDEYTPLSKDDDLYWKGIKWAKVHSVLTTKWE